MQSNSSLDSKEFESKLKVFSSGLGNIARDILKKIGEQMSTEARAGVPRATGKLARAINFLIIDSSSAALTTRKNIKKSNVYYAKFVEHGADIKAKRKEYLTFKINGEWKKVKSVRLAPKPFMRPVWDKYWDGLNSKGYELMAKELENKMNDFFE
jgi:pullulanase/glycogen debranching enzyme